MKEFTPKGERTRKRILETAALLFSEQGFDGVSVDEIVASAGVNKRMIYHYFGNKEKLFLAALSSVYSKLEVLEVQTLHPEDPIDKIIKDTVSAYFAFLQDNPDFVNLVLLENLRHGRDLDQMEAPLTKAPMLDLLMTAVKNGKENGTIRPDVDPRFLLVSLIGNCMIYCSNRFTLSRALNINLESPAILGRAKKSVAALILNGITTG